MTTPGSGQGSYQASVQPPGGMGISSQGYGQEGYVLAPEQDLIRPPEEALNFAVGVPLGEAVLPALRHAVQGFLGSLSIT